MFHDPIVEEVHRIRQKMWDDCGGTLDGLIELFRKSEVGHSSRIISADELANKSDCNRTTGNATKPDAKL
ncbi:MAG: hypothetical protein IPK83_23275 [Planctomycetes bacterium]|nr:hypothetical protein [Planctomycetota bacterium]